MKSFTICALLAAGVSAVPFAGHKHGAVHHPHHKRDVVWVTETDIDTVTIPVTKTVWVDGNSLNANEAAYRPTGYSHRHNTSTAAAQSTTSAQSQATSSSVASSSPSEYSASSYVQSTSSSSSSSGYVAPTTSSTSVYVASTTSSSSEYVAPTTSSTSTSAYVAPYTTSAYSSAASTPASSYAVPTSSSSVASAGGSAAYTGDLTYYDVGLGSCGWTNTDGENVVALAAGMMDKSTDCGAIIEISYGNAKQTATIVDTCPGCAGAGLDLSPSLFASFAPTASGRLTTAAWSVISYATPTA